MSNTYIVLKQYIKALEHKDLFVKLNDSIYNTEKAKAIAQLQIKYKTEQKEKIIIEQQYEIEKVKAEKARQRIIRNLTLASLLLLLIFVMFILNANKQKRKINNLLKQTNEELKSLNETINYKKDIIRESEELLKTTINSANDAIILINNDENIILWNKTAEIFFGYSQKEALNKNIHKLIAPNKYREKAHNAFSGFRQTGKGNALNKTIEVEGVKRNGKIFPIELSLSTVKINNKYHAVGIIRDISERKEYEKTIKENNHRIEIIYKNITDNINYAKLIQQSLLPNKEMLDELLCEYFLLYRAKGIIGGDFYYVNSINNNLIIAVADCTGHGVSGALLSILGISFLYEIVNETPNPAEILTRLRTKIKKIFNTFNSDSKNGFDIALCTINTDTNILKYSGAFNPLYLIREKELFEYKATRNPIGFCYKEKKFEEIEIKLQQNDMLYLFSDGFRDQFGGEKGGKLKSKKFKQLFLEHADKPMLEQKKEIDFAFHKWKNNLEQVDDVTILGINYNNNIG